MTGIQADADPGFIVNIIHDCSKLLKGVADAATLSGGSFKQQTGGDSSGCGKDLIDIIRDPVDAFFFPVSHMRTRMKYNKGDSQLTASYNFLL